MGKSSSGKNLYKTVGDTFFDIAGAFAGTGMSEEIKEHMLSVFVQNPAIFGESLSPDGVKRFLEENISGVIFNQIGENGPQPYVGEHFGDPINDYSRGLNSYNFRSPEFVDSPEIIFAGCSVSFGVGVPYEVAWTEVLAKKLKPKSYVSLTHPGSSTNKIIFSIYRYIRKYGKPKKIYALLPDPYRLSTVLDSDFVLDKHHNKQEKIYSVELHLARDNKQQELVKYSKRPHEIHKILPPEVGYKSFIESVYSLETFCAAADIELIWSSWDITTSTLVTIMNLDSENKAFPSFSLLPYESFYHATKLDHVYDTDCMKKLNESYPSHYSYGTDKGRYPGAHTHAHIAEGFLAAIKGKASKKLK